MSIDALHGFLDEVFPQLSDGGGRQVVIEALTPGQVRVRQRYAERSLRPGGTISGPTMMGLADHAMYVLVLAHIGPEALTVTTNLSINFMRKPGPADLLADARLLKLGKRLAVGDISLYSDGADEMVAHVTCTYSIPGG